MIKRETKYIIRRILIGVGIALILGFINACEVKAETYTIESKNTTLKMYNYSGTNTLTKSYDGLIGNGAYFNLNGNTDPIIKLISGANFTHNNVKLVLFNFKATNNNQNVTNNVGINSISFMGNTCYYTEEYPTIIQQGGTTPTETQPAIYASVICALNTNVNYTTNNPILEVSMSGNPKSTIYFSNITILTDVDNSQILSLLNTINGNIITEQTTLLNIYNRIVDLISTTQTNTTNIINTMQTLINGIITNIQNQQNQAHTDSQTEINNATQNTQDTINSQKVCDYIDKNNIIESGFLNPNGTIGSNNLYGITNYIKINRNTTITLLSNQQEIGAQACFYNINKNYISCIATRTLSENSNITIPTSASFIRFTIVKSANKPTFNICDNGNQALNNSVNDMNDTLKDSNVDSPNDSISQMEQNLPTNSVISDLLTLPIRMFQNIVNAIDGTCSPFSLGALFGTNLILPCINIQNYLGSALWGAIDVIFCGIFVLSMRKKFVQIFENITSLKNGGNELE